MEQPSEQHIHPDAQAISLAPIVGAEADHLLLLSDAYMASLYPAESNHLVSSESLRTGDASFIGAFLHDRDGLHDGHGSGDEMMYQKPVAVSAAELQCVACVAARFHRTEGYAEIKRLYVEERCRGAGLAKRLMARIEAEIVEQGIQCARLEMGIYQPEADALYRSLGYREIPPFGGYLLDPLSQFLEKALP
ncbi:MAG: GNAT family N-acetyltransferase [Luminiphilus sp.]